MTVWTRWLLLGATPELVAEVKTDQKEMGNGSSPAKEQVWQKSVKHDLTVWNGQRKKNVQRFHGNSRS